MLHFRFYFMICISMTELKLSKDRDYLIITLLNPAFIQFIVLDYAIF